MITEDCVSFEVAKLLKEKGCDEIADWGYRENGEIVYVIDNLIRKPEYWGITLQRAGKYIRQTYNLHITIKPYITVEGILYLFEIYKLEQDRFRLLKSKTGFDTNEEAYDCALKYCLTELIK